jgi:hypothetical protein
VTVPTLSFDLQYQYAQGHSDIQLPIELHYGNDFVRLLPKVDTGAANCIFQRDYARALNIDVETGQYRRFSTPSGGSIETWGHQVRILCEGISFETVVYFSNDPHFGRNVLGREGWLDQIHLGIVDHEYTLYMSPNNVAIP